MAVNYTDFEKIWASTSPLTPYSFSDANYKRGWDFVGSTPPSRQMWDAFMQHADEKLQYLYLHEDVPVGHEYFTFNPNVPQGSLPLFGGEYSRETYSALWAWVQQQTGYLKTDAEWQALAASNNGNVPYYSDGDGSTTFRVPSLRCWVKAANGTVTEVGSYKAAGLPNIMGSVNVYTTVSNGAQIYSQISNGAGSLYETNELSQTLGATFSNITSKKINGSIGLNASRSSTIYGNSTTVQPESIVGMWLVKAYGTIVDTGTIDEQQYIDDRIAALPNTFLPLSGGTMGGSILSEHAYKNLTDAGMFRAYSGTDNTSSFLTIYGKNAPSYAGYFQLSCKNGSYTSDLIGSPNGSLTWGGSAVVTKKDETISFTMTTNNGTAGSLSAHRVGNIVCVNFAITPSSTVNIGGSITGTFSGLPRNVNGLAINSASYAGATALIFSGTSTYYTIRITGASLAANNGFGCSFMYPTVE